MAKKKKKQKQKKQKKEKKEEIVEEGQDEAMLDHGVKKSIIAVLVLMIALLFVLSLFGLAGVIGSYIDKALAFLFGWGRYVLPLVMIVLGVLYFKKMPKIRYTLAAVGAILFFLVFLGLVHMTRDIDLMVDHAKQGMGGGYVGLGIAFPLARFLGKIASFVILLGFALIGLMLLFNAPLYKMLEKMKFKMPSLKIGKKQPEEDEEERDEEPDEAEEDQEGDEVDEEQDEEPEEDGDIDDNIKSLSFDERPEDEFLDKQEVAKESSRKTKRKTNIYSGTRWQLPPFNLLQKSKDRPHQANLDETVKIITKTLENFGIEVEPSEYHVGPTVTQYTFKPANGVKLSRILALQNDLALALAAHPVRIEAPIPGKSLVGIEVPNKAKSLVRMRTMLESDIFENRPSDLSVILGENVNGVPVLANIEKMPHMLVAGSTGTGKSVCINVILTTLLYQNSPEDLRLILVDPKRVELSMYNDIPHLLTPVIVESQKVVNTLKWAVSEMEKRYRLLQEVGSRDIHSYNEKAKDGKTRQVTDKETGEQKTEELEKMPYIVIVVDELADLMAAHGKDVEGLIVRLAQMARAVGIHLIVSTQRPSVEVITGLIKANITTRIAFQVASQVDSRTIIGIAGAEKLLGNGDMLFLNAESAQPRRLQGIFISEKEVKRVVYNIKKQAKEIDFDDNEDLSESLEEQLESSAGVFGGPGTEGAQDDELYEQAKEVVLQAKKASTSMLQRRLKIGYSRAARIVDMLEENGVVGPAEGSKPRKLLVDTGPEEVAYEDTQDDQEKRENWEQ